MKSVIDRTQFFPLHAARLTCPSRGGTGRGGGADGGRMVDRPKLECLNSGMLGSGLRLGEENGVMVYWKILLDRKVKDVHEWANSYQPAKALWRDKINIPLFHHSIIPRLPRLRESNGGQACTRQEPMPQKNSLDSQSVIEVPRR